MKVDRFARKTFFFQKNAQKQPFLAAMNPGYPDFRAYRFGVQVLAVLMVVYILQVLAVVYILQVMAVLYLFIYFIVDE